MCLFVTPAFAEKQKAYEIACSVWDDRDGDVTVSKPKFRLHKNRSERPAYVEHIKVSSTNNDMIFAVGYNHEDDLISIALRDDTLEVSAITYEKLPKTMNIFLNTDVAGVGATCHFKLKRIK